MEFLTEYGLFLAKTITFVVAVIVVISIAVSSNMASHGSAKGEIVAKKINDRYRDMKEAIKSVVLDPDDVKAEAKKQKKEEKLAKKEKKKAKKGDKAKEEPSADESSETRKKRVFVLDFDGDIKASATEELREAITAVLSLAEPQDEVVVKLESQGGMVHSYGLASSQLARIKHKNIPLTVCVDKVAASGGYMMACVADKILAAPFAIIGSIGVVAQIPNFHKVLKKNDVDYEMLTAGKYKRTLTMFGENTDEGREKFREDLEDTHVLFKDFIKTHRDSVDVDDVATGEIWFGTRALERNLIDEISTSDEYLTQMDPEADLFEVKYEHKKSLPEKLGLNVAAAIEATVVKSLSQLNTRFWA